MHIISRGLLITISVLFFTCQLSQAGAKHTFKVATIAPAGSVWLKQFQQFASDVNKATNGEVNFIVYPSATMGEDQTVLRKMRKGQLHGGGFTMTGISTIVPDFRVMAIPFLFESYEEVDYVKNNLLPKFKELFHEKNLELLSMTEVGFLYAMSTKEISDIKTLRKTTNWSPAGDPISVAFLTSLDISPIQLTIPDVHSSLQSGLIETVYNSYYGSIIMQWFTKTRYIVETPYGYAYGVFALNRKKFVRLSTNYQQIILKAARTHFSAGVEASRKSNSDSKQVLKEHGVKFLTISEEVKSSLQNKREETVNKLIPNSMSSKVYEELKMILTQFRSKK